MGGHLRVAREVGSYKAAGYTPKSVNPLFSLQAGGAKKKVRKKETPQGEFRALRRATKAPPLETASL